MAGLKQQIPTFLNTANQMSARGDLMVSALVSGSSGPGIVCSLPSVCTLPLVYSLYIQSPVYPQSVFHSLSTICIVSSLPSVCILLLVYSLYCLQFTLSLYFTPCLQCVQSAVYPHSVFHSLSTVCILCSLPSVCILLLVYSLYSLQFTLSLYFTPCLQSVQSAVHPQSVFYSLSTVCIVCSLP